MVKEIGDLKGEKINIWMDSSRGDINIVLFNVQIACGSLFEAMCQEITNIRKRAAHSGRYQWLLFFWNSASKLHKCSLDSQSCDPNPDVLRPVKRLHCQKRNSNKGDALDQIIMWGSWFFFNLA